MIAPEHHGLYLHQLAERYPSYALIHYLTDLERYGLVTRDNVSLFMANAITYAQLLIQPTQDQR